jgi:hypothetical protein
LPLVRISSPSKRDGWIHVENSGKFHICFLKNIYTNEVFVCFLSLSGYSLSIS